GAAGKALLPDNQDGENGGDRLGNDGEVDAADTPFEHGHADDEGEDHRHNHHRDQSEGETVERLPEPGQFGDLIPVHEVGNDWRWPRGWTLPVSGTWPCNSRQVRKRRPARD